MSGTRSGLAVLTALLLAACGGGGGGGGGGTGAAANPPPAAAPPPATPTEPPPGPTAAEKLAEDLDGKPLDETFDRSFAALQQRDPEGVLADALTDVFPLAATALNDLSDAYQDETFDIIETILAALDEFDPDTLSEADRISYEAFRWSLEDRLAERRFRYHSFVATYSNFGKQGRTQRFFTELHPLATRQDARDYIRRLRLIDEKFDQIIDHLRRQRDAGVIEPSLTMGVALNQVGAIVISDPARTPYYTEFRDGLDGIDGLSDEARARLLADALDAVRNHVLPAYRALQSMLRELQAEAPSSIGVGQYPDGRRYYEWALRHHTTTDLTPAEVHQLGLDELERIHHEMRLIFDELGYPQEETLEQLFSRVASDGGVIRKEDAIATFEGYLAFAEERMPEAFDVFPEAEVVVIGGPFGGFYIAPSFDGTRPGAFYAGTSQDLPRYDMPSLTFHETLPGHHYQIALARELDLPPFRQLMHFTGYIEGLGLYAERLAWELGWYEDDPYANLGRLQFEALRAARLVMDTGIHSLGWSFEQAATFNRENVGASQGASQSAAGRYSVWPGQATSYMVGMLWILEQRERARDALGDRFDLKEFHRVVVGNGAIPLAVLARVVDDYIARKLAAE